MAQIVNNNERELREVYVSLNERMALIKVSPSTEIPLIARRIYILTRDNDYNALIQFGSP